MTPKEFLQLAIVHLRARRVARGYQYRDDATGREWVSSAHDLIALGRMLARGEADAYSLWACDTVAREVRS
jgi:hypothetical protein